MAADEDLAEGERTVLLLHPHWKTVLGPVLFVSVVILVSAAAVVLVPPAAGSMAGPARIAIVTVALVVAVVCGGIPLLRRQTTTYQLTTRRLRLRRGILVRSGRDFPLMRISDVSFQHGLADRVLGCGQLTVESAGERGRLVLTDIPHVEKVQAAIFQLVEDEQARLAREEN